MWWLIHIIAIVSFIVFLFGLLYSDRLLPVIVSKKKLSNGESPLTPKKGMLILSCFLFVAFILRIIIAGSNIGFETDIACFSSWADRIYHVGMSEFYNPDIFSDYPPGYLYILYPIGMLNALLQPEYGSWLHLVLVKSPAIVFDLLTAILIYRYLSKKISLHKVLVIVAIYLFIPVVIMNSSYWGQVDSVYTFFVVLLCIGLTTKKKHFTYPIFFVGVLMKPQMLVFAPLLLYGFTEDMLLSKDKRKEFIRHFLYCTLSLISSIIVCLPFGLHKIVPLYLSSLNVYPFVSVNAYNFWAMLGKDFASIQSIPIFGGALFFKVLILVLIVILATFAFLRHLRSEERYFLTGAFLLFTVFCFATGMHERYMYAVLVLLLIVYAFSSSIHDVLLFVILSTLHFYNVIHVFFCYDYMHFDPKNCAIIVLSILMILSWIYFTYRMFHTSSTTTYFFTLSKKSGAHLKTSQSVNRTDVILAGLITLIYGIVAFTNLGNTSAPSTSHIFEQEDASFEITLGNPSDIARLALYCGNYSGQTVNIDYKDSVSGEWITNAYLTPPLSAYSWTFADLPIHTDSIRCHLSDLPFEIYEVALLDSRSIPYEITVSDNKLCDEPQFVPERATSLNGTYFDEIYHVRTAYEYLHQMIAYENTHPPLGKILISFGISLWGMNPFGWRFMGVLFGVLMLPLIYLFAHRMFHSTTFSVLATCLLAFDFMHFTQSRIGTIDIFVVFFSLLMFYFMYEYSKLSFYDVPLSKTFLPLGACGISFGLAVSCKWNAVYGGIGLAIIFFAILCKRYTEYKTAKRCNDNTIPAIKRTHIKMVFGHNTWLTIGFCMVFFVVIPFLIYFFSYIPFIDYNHSDYITGFIANQQNMFSYHKNLEATHYFSSKWYEWPIMVKPIWYYSGVVSQTVREGISAFGNPAIWWVGIPAFFICVYGAIYKKSSPCAILCVAYVAQFLPWVFISRLTFIYHYFPCVPIVILMIVASFQMLSTHCSKRILFLSILIYLVITGILFILFYPVIAGTPVTISYVNSLLRWFSSWILISQ